MWAPVWISVCLRDYMGSAWSFVALFLGLMILFKQNKGVRTHGYLLRMVTQDDEVGIWPHTGWFRKHREIFKIVYPIRRSITYQEWFYFNIH